MCCCFVFHLFFSSICLPCVANRQRHFSISIIKYCYAIFGVCEVYFRAHSNAAYIYTLFVWCTVHHIHYSTEICTYFPRWVHISLDYFWQTASMAPSLWNPCGLPLNLQCALSRWILLSLFDRSLIMATRKFHKA